MKEYKSIVSSTWNEFVKELQSTAKEGKQVVQRLEYSHGFFKAVLVQGYCQSFVGTLNTLTGAEVNCIERIQNLLKAANVKAETVPVEVEQPVEPKDIEVQIVKPKTIRTKRNRK